MTSSPARARPHRSHRLRRSLAATAALTLFAGVIAALAAPESEREARSVGAPPAGPRAAERTTQPGTYRYLLPTSEVIRWPTGAAIGVWVDPGGGERGRALHAAATRAAREWNGVAGRDRYRLSPGESLAEAEVAVIWSDRASAFDTSRCPVNVPGSAVTAFCVDPSRPGRLEAIPAASAACSGEAHVRMLVVLDARLSDEPARLERVVAHEMGHVLGIGGHSSDPSDLMWAGRLRTASPSPSDRATIHALYRQQPEIRP